MQAGTMHDLALEIAKGGTYSNTSFLWVVLLPPNPHGMMALNPFGGTAAIVLCLSPVGLR